LSFVGKVWKAYRINDFYGARFERGAYPHDFKTAEETVEVLKKHIETRVMIA
jgi:hypothetical protein